MLMFAGEIQWVNIRGKPTSVSSEWTGNDGLRQKASLFEKREVIGHVHELPFRDPDHFFAGELNKH